MKLTPPARAALKAEDFALPGRHYPIHDEEHARNALSRGSAYATPAQFETIKQKVKARYPGMKVA